MTDTSPKPCGIGPPKHEAHADVRLEAHADLLHSRIPFSAFSSCVPRESLLSTSSYIGSMVLA